jgi:PKD repeat protein
VDWAEGDHLTMVKEIRPESCLPFIFEWPGLGYVTLEDGYYEYSSVYGATGPQHLRPYANLGPPACAFEGDAVMFYSRSCHPRPDCAITNHAWFFDGGVTVTGATGFSAPGLTGQASPGDPLVVTYPSAGMYYPHLTVTDCESMTMRGYRPVMIFGRENNQPYRDFQVGDLAGTADSRFWRLSITVFGDADIEEFPGLAYVVLFAEDFYNDQAVSIGGHYCHRENIIFSGYIEEGSTTVQSDRGAVTFQVVGMCGLMDKLAVWPANLVTQTGADVDWHIIQDMNADCAARHVFGEHSTIDHIADIYPSYDSKELRAVDLAEGDLQDQLDRQLYSAIGVDVLSSRQGMIYCDHDPQLLPASSRTAVPGSMLLRPTDVAEAVELGSEFDVMPVSQIVLSAFGYDPSGQLVSYDALSPPDQENFGSVRKFSGMLVETQEEANALADLLFHRENDRFARVGLTLGGNYRLFDIAPREYLRLVMHASENTRGIRWANRRLLPTEVRLSFEHEGIINVSLVAQKDSLEAEGIVGAYPSLDALSDLPAALAYLDGFTGPPVVDFAGFPTAGVGDSLQVQFSDHSIGCDLIDWEWQFGDGTPTGAGQNPVHTYTGATAYDVKLIVSSPWGTASIVKPDYVSLRASRPPFEQIDTLTLVTGDGGFRCCAADLASGMGYFGTDTNKVVKIDLPNLARAGAYTGSTGPVNVALVDGVSGMGYFGTLTDPVHVWKLNLASMSLVASGALVTGAELNAACGVLDKPTEYIYIGCNPGGATGRVVKVAMADVTRQAAVDFLGDESSLLSAAGGVPTGYSYWTCNMATPKLVRVNIAHPAFARVDRLIFSRPYVGLGGLAIGATADAVMYGGSYYARQAMKFGLDPDYEFLGARRLDTGDLRLRTCLYDSVGNHLFYCTNIAPVRLIKVDLTDMSRVTHIDVPGSSEIPCGLIDSANGYIYLGVRSDPPLVLRYGTGD